MSSPAIFSTATAPTVNNRLIISPTSFTFASNHSTLQNINLKKTNQLVHRIKSSASDSITIDGLNPASASGVEEENPVKVGAKVKVKVPLTVYHIPKVPEVEMQGKEGKIKENVATWKGKSISANFPIKVEFLEQLEGRGDKPVKFFVHLREDEFDYID